ncbi:TRAP transporter small permease [Sphingomonas sp. M1-B02]|uniref:TRAP transporter small permease n=1 Tax=Sphingomonas sp. M1-B02 TaxID=3114300 RepID=UPI00223FBBB8|nr:TRAP transporter small permease subunit [Sphingomonas sp. S6-11]UZK67007.1 TRAP transporter small permease [Sphingomonas sp. S6-11]
MSLPVTDAAPPVGEENAASGIAGKAAFYIGSAGLLLATAADSIAVLGRHTGFALLGSIEIVQAAIVFIAAASMVSVTLAHGHAAVHILTDRLPPARRQRLARIAALLGTLAVGLLMVGSLILLCDLWNAHERSELLHIPLRWFRLLMIIALGIVAILFLKAAFARRPVAEGGHDA